MPKGMKENRMEKRLQREIEGLYGNEALTSDLDDSSAKVFLKWAEDRVRNIVDSTENLDDDAADDRMYPRLKAIRRMARYVNQAIAEQTAAPELIEKIIEQAKVLYGKSFAEPDRQKLQAMLMRRSDATDFIQALKMFLEGEVDGKEEDD
ncbi:MAG: hypothetical protein P8046_01560 [Anaerolineales bacterium]